MTVRCPFCRGTGELKLQGIQIRESQDKGRFKTPFEWRKPPEVELWNPGRDSREKTLKHAIVALLP